MSWYCYDANKNLTLHLYIQPGARKTEAVGLHGEALKIRLAAPPVDGKANRQLIKFLSVCFGVPLRQVELVRGQQSRHKTVVIRQPAGHPNVLYADTAT